MKTTILTIAAISVLSSCKKLDLDDLFKKDHTEVTCPLVSSENIPMPVMQAFYEKHPDVPVDYWFNMDDKGYYAQFTATSGKMIVSISNDGTFLSETAAEADEHHGEHHETGCEPEIEED
jgi:hypothetical protein